VEIDAIIWDYDGTLVNSALKNIDITRQILARVAPRLSGNGLPKWLKTEQEYHIANHASKNWQDLYLNFYGLTEKETFEAGKLWTEYQLKNTVPVSLFPEISETVRKIDCPQGICSQNSAKNISKLLESANLLDKFKSIIGYDDIPDNAQKPNPHGGIKCLEQIIENTENKAVIYIGDHEGDIEFARNIEKELKNIKVISVLVKYSGANPSQWNFKPDFEIDKPGDLLKLIV
jgi:phosphoglycolate phosphatase-like HAD superfamily hydrolase